MYIRMDELRNPVARRADSAGVSRTPIGTIQILEKGDAQTECLPAVLVVEHQGVRHLLLSYHRKQRRLNPGVPLYLRKCHNCLNELNLAISAR